jgi:hypothetical protein
MCVAVKDNPFGACGAWPTSFAVLVVALMCVPGLAEQLPSFTYADLVTPSPTTLLRLTEAVTNAGILKIDEIPNFSQARRRALEPLADCLEAEDEGSDGKGVMRMVMSDGSHRRTTHASTTRGQGSAFSSETCGSAVSDLRAAIDAGMRQLLFSLDHVRTTNKNAQGVDLMRPSYTAYEDIMRHGEHLEHLHVYYSAPGPVASASSSAQALGGAEASTIKFHTDGGLFIAMTAGLYSGTQESPSSGLFAQLPSGEQLRISSAECGDSLVFMVGEGGSKWLAPVLGKPLRAVPHKLVAALPVGAEASRAWYGKMYLPPADALIPGGAKGSATYASYRTATNRQLTAPASASASSISAQGLPAACGSDFTLTASASCTASDGSAGVTCWMQCMSTSSLSCGTQALCYDSANGEVNDGNTMCPSTCYLVCPNTYDASLALNGTSGATGPAVQNNYCYGTGSTMIMAGFMSQAASGTKAPCLAFLFPSWILDGPVKFAFACLGTLLLGVLVQFVTKLRLAASKWKQSQTRFKTLIVAVLYAANTTLGYVLMLVAMTYSTELFLMVVLGLSLGYGVFLSENHAPVSTDPCCADGDVKDNCTAHSLHELLVN